VGHYRFSPSRFARHSVAVRFRLNALLNAASEHHTEGRHHYIE
jgi:hypothetical protein